MGGGRRRHRGGPAAFVFPPPARRLPALPFGNSRCRAQWTQPPTIPPLTAPPEHLLSLRSIRQCVRSRRPTDDEADGRSKLQQRRESAAVLRVSAQRANCLRLCASLECVCSRMASRVCSCCMMCVRCVDAYMFCSPVAYLHPTIPPPHTPNLLTFLQRREPSRRVKAGRGGAEL